MLLLTSHMILDFFARHAEEVARDLLGKKLIRTVNGKTYEAIIVETESYHGAQDPASRAFKGKNKISALMWHHPGTILIYNVHKYKMFNIVTGKFNEPSAVLIRAVEPLNFDRRCCGPGLLTLALDIDNNLHGQSIISNKAISIIDNNNEQYEIATSLRIGVADDLERHQRFYIKNNRFVSR